MRLIDADVIIARCETVEKNNELSATEANRLGWLKEMIQMMPTADPVRHGRWLFTDTNTCECSVCHTCEPYPFSEFEWCPNCGARMDGGTDNATD